MAAVAAPSPAATSALRMLFDHGLCDGHWPLLQPCSGVSMIASRCSFCLNVTLAMPSMVRSLSSGTFIGPGEGAVPGRRLRKRRRARGVEGDVAFDLLHHLVDVAVEHGHRAEALEIRQRLGAIVGAPAPIRIDRPQRDVGEDDDRSRRRTALQVVFEPFELIGAEIAEAAGLEIDDVDEADEVHAVGVEASTSRRPWCRGRSARR